ncbi:MAG: hypothetical protein IT305_18565 [Chloroflexi bacterium]|nr:hypothetical protein [Chloroflexota bacterium]
MAKPTAMQSSATAPIVMQSTVTAPPGPVPTPRVLIDERFANNQRGWPNDRQATAWLENGAYRLFARTPGNFVAIGVPEVRPQRSVTVTARFRKVGGPAGGGYGVVIGDRRDGPRDGINQRGQYYVLEVGDRAEFGIWRRDDDRWIDLISWTPSSAIKPGGAANELQVQVDGDSLVFLVNGTELTRQRDAALSPGALGVFVGGDGNQVVLERVYAEGID